MGNSVSCFDPVREHPPYSWPKDHPGRDAAIAEKKRQRRQQKIVGLKGSIPAVSRESAKDVEVSRQEEGSPGEQTLEDTGNKYATKEFAEKGTEEADPLVEQTSDVIASKRGNVEVAEEAKNVISFPDPVRADMNLEESSGGYTEGDISNPVGDGVGRAVPALGSQIDTCENAADGKKEFHTASGEESVGKLFLKGNEEDGAGAGCRMPPVTIGDLSDIQDRNDREAEGVLFTDEKCVVAVPQNPEEEVLFGEEVNELELAAVEQANDEFPLEEEATGSDQAIADRRAMFEHTADELPEPKELSRDVHDPVTGELISLAEYRVRQMARAEGLVKERVEQYEDVVDETAKELAEQAAIEAVRAEVTEKHQWTFKGETEVGTQPGCKEDDESKENEAVGNTASIGTEEARSIPI